MKLLCPILLAAVCTSTLAQSDTTFMPEGTRDIYVSVVAARVPRAEGSRQMRTVVLPTATVQWSNGVFLEPGMLGMQLSEDGMLRYGPLLAYGVKSERRDNPEQRTRFNLEPGAFISHQLLHNLNLYGRVLYGGGDDHRGVLADMGATFSTPLAPHHTASLSLGANFADHAYMQSYFGLTAQQARRDRLPEYRAGAGLRSIYLSGSWNVELSNKYSLDTGVSVNRLGQSAAASPLTEQRHGYTLYSALSYRF